MKKIVTVMVLLAGLGAASCRNNTEGEKADAPTETNAAVAPVQTAQMAYICPMECEGSASNTPGKCPVCAMDLVKNPHYTGAIPDSAAQTN